MSSYRFIRFQTLSICQILRSNMEGLCRDSHIYYINSQEIVLVEFPHTLHSKTLGPCQNVLHWSFLKAKDNKPDLVGGLSSMRALGSPYWQTTDNISCSLWHWWEHFLNTHSWLITSLWARIVLIGLIGTLQHFCDFSILVSLSLVASMLIC